ncbi:MAG: aminotransferase class V-fold PLP-dependent enzyme, partial [Gemmatimonadetes bacterium]|nr:aminotransferase class V-fold PLP-dependent enzyme [Gemmatimonadota bacterium]
MDLNRQPLEFGTATPRDLDRIRRINHQAFAEEIPQHPMRPDGRLIDRFEADSLFVVARDGDDVVGMLAVRFDRPFSLDSKLPLLDSHLPPGRHVCEVRLLAVDVGRRHGPVLRGLLQCLVRECDTRGFDLAVLSATTRQIPLYRHLGCVAFGPLVGAADARFQPMYVTREALVSHVGSTLGIADHRARDPETAHSAPPTNGIPACFMTGPVTLSPAVRERICAPLISHRSDGFAYELDQIRSGLGALTGAHHVAVLAGSGTLGNDVVAFQLKALGGRGVVVSNGEFGARLCDHAVRAGLHHVVLRRPWGAPVDPNAVEHAVRRTGATWIWAVHCETSTGMLNDLDALRGVAASCGCRLAVDAASSVGTLPVNLSVQPGDIGDRCPATWVTLLQPLL